MAEFDSEPDYACPDCFAHPWLREFVVDESTHRGDCPSCGSSDKPLVPVHKLYEPFRNLMSSYKPAAGPPMESGEPIVMLIQDRWQVFSDDLVTANREGALLEAIMDSGWDDDSGEPRLSAYDHYVDSPWYHETLDQIWEEFACEVKRNPTRPLRFRDADFDDFLFQELLGRRTVLVPEETILYRARLGFARLPEGGSIRPFSGSEIGAPPPPGRATPAGRSVLYRADQERTAVAEVRPARGEYVSVAEIRATKEPKILDLVTEPERPNPFVSKSGVNDWGELDRLLVAFGEQLERPLRARDDLTDYIPSQKLAERIEDSGANGIRYPSAMAPGGTNVVLFDPSVAEIGPSWLVEIVSVQIEYREPDETL
jgi:RES domain-containing protein